MLLWGEKEIITICATKIIPPLRTVYHNSKHLLHLGAKIQTNKQTIQSKIGSCQIALAHYVKCISMVLDFPKYVFFEIKLYVLLFPMFCLWFVFY